MRAQRSRRNAQPRNERAAHARERALAALSLMRRDGVSLAASAKAEGTDPQTVLRYVGSAIHQDRRGGRYQPAPYDRIARTLNFPSGRGIGFITVHDSRTASKIGEYMNAVRSYLRTGDASGLAQFRGASFRAGGSKHTFVTDLRSLDKFADAGLLAIEGLYRSVQGG